MTKKPASEAETLEKIADLPERYRDLGGRLHALILRSAPELCPTLWYGMPADRCLTFALTDKANYDLDPGAPHRLRESAWF